MIIEGQVHGRLTRRSDRHGTGDPLRRRGQRDDGLLHGLFSCRPRSRPRIGRPTGPRHRRRIIRSAPRASAKARMSAGCRASPTRSTTHSRSSARPTSRCRTTIGAPGRRRKNSACMGDALFRGPTAAREPRIQQPIQAPALAGPEKAAIFLALIGEDLAGAIAAELQEKELVMLRQGVHRMAQIETEHIDEVFGKKFCGSSKRRIFSPKERTTICSAC